MSSSTTIKYVEVRTWPERSDVVVIDVDTAIILAHFPYIDPAPGKVADIMATYNERATRAIAQAEAQQDLLREHYQTAPDTKVKLVPTDSVRKIVADTLSEYDISMDQVEMRSMPKLIEKLDTMDLDRLFALLCDWFDVVDRRYPAGSSVHEDLAWVQRARPEGCHQFHFLALEIPDRSQASEGDTLVAQEYFRRMIDTPLEDFSLGNVIRWVYFHRAEFSELERFQLHALEDAAFE